MTSKIKSLYTSRALIDNIKNNIFPTFHYSIEIINEFRKFFEEFEYIFEKEKLNIDYFKKVNSEYIEFIEKTPFYDENKSLILTRYIKKIKNILDSKDSLLKLPLNYDFPYKYQSYFDLESLKEDNYTIGYGQAKLISTETHFNIFRELFENKKIEKELLLDFLSKFNQFFDLVFPKMISFFLEDLTHKKFLMEKILYQEKVEIVMNSVIRTGTLDTTRVIRQNFKIFLERIFKIKSPYLDYFIHGINYKDDKENEKLLRSNVIRFSHIIIRKEPPFFKDNTLSSLITLVKEILSTKNISFSYNNRVFSFKTLSVDLEDLINQDTTFQSFLFNNIQNSLKKIFPQTNSSFLLQNSPLLNSHSYKRTTTRHYLKTKEINLNFSSYFILNKNPTLTLEIKTFDEIITNLFENISFSFDFQEPSFIPILRPTISEEKISFKIFDLIEYIINLAFNVRKFLEQSMDLRAILKKQKYTEKWDGSKGWIDVNASIVKSISKGLISPMQSYRKKQQEVPPTIFLVYDTSGSMINETRMSQFITLLLLSFFEYDVNKFIMGWITESSLRMWQYANYDELYADYFKSKARRLKDKKKSEIKEIEDKYSRKLTRVSSTTNQYFEDLKTYVAYSNMSNLLRDYTKSEYREALRDFLDNEWAGLTGTAIDVFNYLPQHFDMENRGLKYVFVLTDGDFSSRSHKLDFVNVSNYFIQRNDIRYFFIWNMRQFWSDDSDSLFKQSKEYHFATKQFLRREIDKQILDENQNLKSSFDDGKVGMLSFAYQHYDKVHFVRPKVITNIGELKYILYRLEKQKFFIP